MLSRAMAEGVLVVDVASDQWDLALRRSDEYISAGQSVSRQEFHPFSEVACERDSRL